MNKIEKYLNTPYINQSLLKKLLIHPQKFKEELEKERDDRQLPKYFLTGKLVDVLVTEPQLVDEYFYNIKENIEKPSENIIKILYQLLDRIDENNISLNLEDYSEILIELSKENNYRSNIKNKNTLLKYLLTDNIKKYWENIVMSRNKIIITNEEYEKAFKLSTKINKLLYTRFPKNMWDYEFQVPLYARINSVSVKGLLDIKITNKKTDEIVIIDVKTTQEYLKNFDRAVRANRLDIQSSFYTDLLAENEFIEQEQIKYKINFYFLVASKTSEEVAFFDAKKLYDVGKFGRGEVYYNGVKIKNKIIGYLELLDLYKFYTVKGFDVDFEVLNNNFNIVLDF